MGILSMVKTNGKKMDSLRNFLNSMSTADQEKFAASCGTTIGYLRKAVYSKSEIGPELSVRIEIESKHKVTRKTLHPRNYMLKWPELATKEKRLGAND